MVRPLRELDRVKVPYTFHTFECPEALSGVEVAQMLGQDPDRVFKTLVTIGKSGEHYVFMIPVAEELDLKKPPMRSEKKRSIWLNLRNY